MVFHKRDTMSKLLRQRKRKLKQLILSLHELKSEFYTLYDASATRSKEQLLYEDAKASFAELLRKLRQMQGYYETHPDS